MRIMMFEDATRGSLLSNEHDIHDYNKCKKVI